jgi:hypothetical protein
VGQIFELQHGESIKADFQVWPKAKIEEMRKKPGTPHLVPAPATVTGRVAPTAAPNVKPTNILRDIRLSAEPILAEMAQDHGYGLTKQQVVRRVAPPFDPIRMRFYEVGNPSQAKSIPEGPSGMIFHWTEGKLSGWGMTFGPSGTSGYTLSGLLDALTGFKEQSIDGTSERLNLVVPGDWVVRRGAREAEIIERLQTILQKELALPIRLVVREVPRDVYVARGDYKLTPLPNRSGQEVMNYENRSLRTDEIEVFGKELALDSGGGGGTGSYAEFLNWVGNWIDTPIVSEASTVPTREISWNLHQRSPATSQMRAEDHDSTAVLANITKQTGLTFTKETRSVRVLYVEEAN